VQAVALEGMGAPDDEVARAREAFVRWQPPDDAPLLKSACSARSPACARERVPVHVHPMHPMGADVPIDAAARH
jgi:hypothetical protein